MEINLADLVAAKQERNVLSRSGEYSITILMKPLLTQN
jgi:hypothetical protein